MTLPLAVIREAECIGCAKCIQACPVDAILGSARSMHTVIADECIGCKLCLPPCPVDCIDLISGSEEPREKAGQAKKRVLARKERLRNSPENKPLSKALAPEAGKTYIQDAIARIKAAKINPV